MTREEKIAAIYKEMANKELSFGCIVKTNQDETKMICSELVNGGTSVATIPYPKGAWCSFTSIYNLKGGTRKHADSGRVIEEIIGHPVMIGDVVDYTGEKKIDIVWSDSSCAIDIRDGENSLNLFNLWGNKRTPIEDQSDECIDYVYSLIQKD